MFDEYNKHDLKVYAAYLNEDDEILNSASGGVATALAKEFILSGGVVAGVAYNSDFSGAEYILVDCVDDLTKLKGSKVITAKLNNIFEKIRDCLERQQKVLFFGLPCLVYGLKKYLSKECADLYCCELICSGRVSQKVHIDYCKFLENKFHSKIKYFTVRHKESAWLPEYLYAKFENGQEFKYPFKQTEYGIGFKILKEECCLCCDYRGNNRYGDVMIGDFWGATENDIFWNKNGVSVVFAQNTKGVNLIENNCSIKKYQVNFEKAVISNQSVIHRISPHPERDIIYPIFKKYGLFKAMKKSKIMRKIKCMNRLAKIPGFVRLRTFYSLRRKNDKRKENIVGCIRK